MSDARCHSAVWLTGNVTALLQKRVAAVVRQRDTNAKANRVETGIATLVIANQSAADTGGRLGSVFNRG